MKQNETGRTRMGEIGNTYKILVGKPEADNLANLGVDDKNSFQRNE
jgi:hypothetical protein